MGVLFPEGGYQPSDLDLDWMVTQLEVGLGEHTLALKGITQTAENLLLDVHLKNQELGLGVEAFESCLDSGETTLTTE